jgi:hypothetical protein
MGTEEDGTMDAFVTDPATGLRVLAPAYCTPVDMTRLRRGRPWQGELRYVPTPPPEPLPEIWFSSQQVFVVGQQVEVKLSSARWLVDIVECRPEGEQTAYRIVPREELQSSISGER